MTDVTLEEKIRFIADDVFYGMTEKELYDYVVRNIVGGLELLPESDIHEMYDEVYQETNNIRA